MSQIRRATTDDLEAVCSIYAAARAFMHANGNPTQWPGDYPGLSDAEKDLERLDAVPVRGQVPLEDRTREQPGEEEVPLA